MPATPAWPPSSLPRLFVRQPLGDGARVELDARQANYLGNVLRMGIGSELLLFDGHSGEWLARIAEAGKKRMTLSVERRTREPETIPDVWLAFAPVKRAQTDWLVEKATELGAARLIPVVTQRTIAERVRLERLEAIAIEAAEQCGRTRLPEIAEPMPLKALAPGDGANALFRRRGWRGSGGGSVQARRFDDPGRPRRRLHRRRARDDPRRRPTPSQSRSARGSCAPRPPRSPRSRLTWPWPAIGGLSAHKRE